MPVRRRRRSRKWVDDPMVLISPVVVRALLRQRRLTVSELARRSENSQQTLAHLAQGYGWKRCRRSRVQAIARALRAPMSLLEGKDFAVPSGKQRGFEYMYSADTIIAARNFFLACQRAVVRDVEGGGSEPTSNDAYLASHFAMEFLGDLLSIGFWRTTLLTWKDPERQLSQEPVAAHPGEFLTRPVEDVAHEDATLSLIHALEHILKPWLDGDAQLHYRTLRDLANEPVGDDANLVNPLSIIPRADEEGRAKEPTA